MDLSKATKLVIELGQRERSKSEEETKHKYNINPIG
jgi:hypothetical protein